MKLFKKTTKKEDFENHKINRGLEALRNSPRTCFALITDKYPKMKGMARVRLIRKLYNLKYPPTGPEVRSKTAKGAVHKVNPPGTGKQYAVLT